jgi:hypothetical protein
MVEAVVLAQVKIGGAKGFFPAFELFAGRDVAGCRCARTERVKVGPQGAADKTHALHHHTLLLQPDQAQALACLAQARVGGVKVQAVVFVVARDEQHRRWPASAALGHR